MDPSYSTDLKRCTVDVERIGAGWFITGFAWGVLTLALVIACFDWLSK